MDTPAHNLEKVQKISELLRLWGIQKNIFLSSRKKNHESLNKDTKATPKLIQKYQAPLKQERSSIVEKHADQKSVSFFDHNPVFCKTQASNELMTKPSWHISPAIHETMSSLPFIKNKPTQELVFADLLILMTEQTYPATHPAINYFIEKLTSYPIRVQKQIVGNKRGLSIPFSFLLLAPAHHENQIDWPSLTHTIFVDWNQFDTTHPYRQALWTKICFFLNKRMSAKHSPSMLK